MRSEHAASTQRRRRTHACCRSPATRPHPSITRPVACFWVLFHVPLPRLPRFFHSDRIDSAGVGCRPTTLPLLLTRVGCGGQAWRGPRGGVAAPGGLLRGSPFPARARGLEFGATTPSPGAPATRVHGVHHAPPDRAPGASPAASRSPLPAFFCGAPRAAGRKDRGRARLLDCSVAPDRSAFGVPAVGAPFS